MTARKKTTLANVDRSVSFSDCTFEVSDKKGEAAVQLAGAIAAMADAAKTLASRLDMSGNTTAIRINTADKEFGE